MGTLATLWLILAASAVLIPALVLFLECSLAVLTPTASRRPMCKSRPSIAVLIPAHDERTVIGTTVRHLVAQLGPADRLVVIADNCTDETAALARMAGANVVERQEPDRRGKGYALEHGVRHLADQSPDVLVVVDADCTLQPGSLELLAREAWARGRPAQALNVVVPPAGAHPLDALSAFAFLVKNVVRPSGLARLGLPCPLVGTGMAFPWPVIRDAPLATSALAEDLQLGLALTLAGHPPVLCFEALVSSPLPRQRRAQETQRRRWEHGHLVTLFIDGPRLLRLAVRRLDVVLLGAALDLCVPPLSLLVLASLAVLVISVTAGALGVSWVPTLLALGAVALVGLSVLEAWVAFGRRDYPLTMLLAAPIYAFGKIPLYLAFAVRRQRAWVRTEREPGEEAPTEAPAAPPGPAPVPPQTGRSLRR